jgi:hypothetical protein
MCPGREVDGPPIGTAASVRQFLYAAFLITIENLVACLAGNSELPAELGYRLAGEPQTAVSRPSRNTPSMASLPPQKGKSATYVSDTICCPCVGSLLWRSMLGSGYANFHG